MSVPMSARTYHHEFGTIAEDGGVVTYTCQLDAAKAPYAITHVVPGCPCVRVEYPRATVKRGERAKIKIIYDPANQYRHFTKSVYLRRSDGVRDTLMMTGTVKMTRKKVDVNEWSADAGRGLRLRKLPVDCGSMVAGSTRVVSIDVKNGYEAGMGLDLRPTGANAAMLNVVSGLRLGPLQQGRVRVAVTIPRSRARGRVTLELTPTVNGVDCSPIPLQVMVR